MGLVEQTLNYKLNRLKFHSCNYATPSRVTVSHGIQDTDFVNHLNPIKAASF